MASYFHYHNFYPKASYWYDPEVDVPKKWNENISRKVKYVSINSKCKYYLVFFEMDNDPNEKSMARDLGKYGNYIFLTIVFNGDEYRVEENPYGREAWLDLAGDKEVLEYANDRNYIKNETSCPKWLFKKLLSAKSFKITFGHDLNEKSSLGVIHSFKMPPLKRYEAEGFVRDAGNLPKELMPAMEKAIINTALFKGLIVISADANSNMDYEGIVFTTAGRLSTPAYPGGGYFNYVHFPSLRPHKPEISFLQDCNYFYVRPHWIIFEDSGRTLLELISNPLFDLADYYNGLDFLVNLSLANKYFPKGSVYFFENNGSHVAFTRLK